MKAVTIYTDGSCLENPGPGGWCSILVYKGVEKIFSGGEKHTTNNRMELKAIIEGLSRLKEPCEVEIVSDSQYVTNAFNNNWIESWQAKNWKKSDKSPVLNKDLWLLLIEQTSVHQVKFTHIRGHQGHLYNERCDEEARRQSELFKESRELEKPE